jgi:hypothetical protein
MVNGFPLARISPPWSRYSGLRHERLAKALYEVAILAAHLACVAREVIVDRVLCEF